MFFQLKTTNHCNLLLSLLFQKLCANESTKQNSNKSCLIHSCLESVCCSNNVCLMYGDNSSPLRCPTPVWSHNCILLTVPFSLYCTHFDGRWTDGHSTVSGTVQWRSIVPRNKQKGKIVFHGEHNYLSQFFAFHKVSCKQKTNTLIPTAAAAATTTYNNNNNTNTNQPQQPVGNPQNLFATCFLGILFGLGDRLGTCSVLSVCIAPWDHHQHPAPHCPTRVTRKRVSTASFRVLIRLLRCTRNELIMPTTVKTK